MVDSHSLPTIPRGFLDALSADEWFGRQPLLEQLTRRLRQAPPRGPQIIALLGPPGAGKSELLRQGALRWSDRRAELTPVYFDLARLRERYRAGDDALPVAAPRLWADLLLGALAQMLFAAGRLEPAELASPGPAPATLLQVCSAEPWRALADLVATPCALERASAAFFDAFLGMTAALPLPRPLILLDGLSRLAPADARAWLHAVAGAARRAGCALLIESPANPDAAGLWSMGEIEPLALPPLAADEALALVQLSARRRGVALEPACCLPVCERLGPWPGWLHAWVRQLPTDGIGLHPRRLAEQAYVDLLADAPWSRRLIERFEAVVPLPLREPALRLVQRAAGRAEPLAAAEVLDLLGVLPAEADRLLRMLAGLHLVVAVGPRWVGPRHQALADWVELRVAPATLQGDLAGARAAMLTRLLSQPRPVLSAEAPHAAARLLPEILARFNGQALPEVLFKFCDYYEAVGRLDLVRRREAVVKARQTLRVPEVIGVAAVDAVDQPPIFHARAYREGKYQRSHEELWIAVDLSTARSLTTPEIQQTRDRADQLRRRLGAPAFRLWLVIGEAASADALELLRREKILCSNLEQLIMLRDLVADLPDQHLAEAEVPTAEPLDPPAPPPTFRAVIDLQPPSPAPQAETTLLRLPAREDGEYIAALMAEKIAIRADFSQVEAGKVKTSVLEGVLNAIEHSPNPEKLVDIQFRLTPEALEVLIENEGPAFDPLEVSEPDPRVKLTAGNKRGWGITLMKKFMDEVDYEPCGRGTRLRLLKRRASGGQSAADRQGKASSS